MREKNGKMMMKSHSVFDSGTIHDEHINFHLDVHCLCSLRSAMWADTERLHNAHPSNWIISILYGVWIEHMHYSIDWNLLHARRLSMKREPAIWSMRDAPNSTRISCIEKLPIVFRRDVPQPKCFDANIMNAVVTSSCILKSTLCRKYGGRAIIIPNEPYQV